MAAIRLKELQSRRNSLLSKLKAKQLELDEAQGEVSELQRIERKMGVDLDEVRGSIMTEQTREQIRQFGSGKFPIGDGLRIVVKKNVVVSVIGEK